MPRVCRDMGMLPSYGRQAGLRWRPALASPAAPAPAYLSSRSLKANGPPRTAAARGATRRDARAHRNHERPASTRRRGQTGPAGVSRWSPVSARHSTGCSVRFWTGPPPGQSAGPGPVPWSWAGPLVRDRSAATASAGPVESRTARRSAAPERRPAARRRGTRYVPRTPPSDGRPGTAGPGPLTPQRRRRAADCGRMRAAGKLRACARRGRGYASFSNRPGTGMLRCRDCAAGRRPGRRCDRAATPARPSDQGGRPSHGPATRRGREGPGTTPGNYLRCRPGRRRRAEL